MANALLELTESLSKDNGCYQCCQVVADVCIWQLTAFKLKFAREGRTYWVLWVRSQVVLVVLVCSLPLCFQTSSLSFLLCSVFFLLFFFFLVFKTWSFVYWLKGRTTQQITEYSQGGCAFMRQRIALPNLTSKNVSYLVKSEFQINSDYF